jgi:hypothetical protein
MSSTTTRLLPPLFLVVDFNERNDDDDDDIARANGAYIEGKDDGRKKFALLYLGFRV